jgi:hypothetical protein
VLTVCVLRSKTSAKANWLTLLVAYIVVELVTVKLLMGVPGYYKILALLAVILIGYIAFAMLGNTVDAVSKVVVGDNELRVGFIREKVVCLSRPFRVEHKNGFSIPDTVRWSERIVITQGRLRLAFSPCHFQMSEDQARILTDALTSPASAVTDAKKN